MVRQPWEDKGINLFISLQIKLEAYSMHVKKGNNKS